MKCPRCSAEVGAGSAYCASCGLVLSPAPSLSREGASDVGLPSVRSIPDPAARRIGRIAERYEILSFVGRGGMGLVYKARDLELGEQIAIKLLPPSSVQDRTEVERLKREIIAARKITHPNVVRLHDFGTFGEEAFVTMEFLGGGTLSDRIRLGEIPILVASKLAVAVSDGMAAAHTKGIIHRDIKPANVLFDDERTPKLVDFGLARLASSTSTTGLCGTPHYISPETVEGGEVSTRSDVYSMGVLLFELFTRKRPFESNVVMHLIRLHATQPPPNPRTARADIPLKVEQIILKCLEKNPAKRFGDGPELAEALASATGLERRSSITGSTVADSISSGPRARRTGISILALAGGMAIGGLVIYPRLRSSPAPVASPTPTAVAVASPPSSPTLPAPPHTATPRSPATHSVVGAPSPLRLASASGSEGGGRMRAAVPTPTLTGRLAVRANSWVEILEGDKDLGRTPLSSPLSLPSGKHTLTFRNKGYNLSETREVEISPDRTTEVSVNVQEQTIQVRPPNP